MIAVKADPVPHPEHTCHQDVGGSGRYWIPAKPVRTTGILGWQLRRACRKRGGHWWHPDPKSMIGWYCCQCGAERDGSPKDGT